MDKPFYFCEKIKVIIMENKKEVTIEDLAGMVQKGFLEIKEDIQQLKHGQEKLFKGQEEMKEKLDKKS